MDDSNLPCMSTRTEDLILQVSLCGGGMSPFHRLVHTDVVVTPVVSPAVPSDLECFLPQVCYCRLVITNSWVVSTMNLEVSLITLTSDVSHIPQMCLL